MLSISSVYKNKFVFILYIVSRNKKLAVFVFAVTLFIIKIFWTLLLGLILYRSHKAHGHLIMVSTTYYRNSTYYEPNTVAMLFNAEVNIPLTQKWKCISKNIDGEKLITETKPRYAYPIVPNCKWSTFIANCTTINNLVSVELSVEDKTMELPMIRHASTDPLPIVACFSPLFFNERWQLVALSIESYALAGISKQAYYLMSAVEGVYELLKFYESRKIIDINLWTLPSHSEARIQLDWRNQGAAHSDCFLKYREAADFIIISDIDDLLFPKNEFQFLKELQFFAFLYPNASAFFYPRFDSEIEAALTLKNFNMKATLESIKISSRIVTGKSILRTSLVETAWLHWAGITKQKKHHKILEMTSSIFVHLRNWNFVENHTKLSTSKFISKSSLNLFYPNLKSVVSSNFMKLLNDQFSQKFQNASNLQNLTSTAIYYNPINSCYNKMLNSINEHYKIHTEPASLCPTPARCHFIPVPNVSCAVATASYKTAQLSDSFFVDVLIDERKIEMNENGCKIN